MPDGERVTLTKDNADAFRELVMAKQRAMDAGVEEHLAQLTTPVEDQLARALARLWEQAQWMRFTSVFPNGRPMTEQYRVKLRLWGMMLGAMNEREARLMKGS